MAAAQKGASRTTPRQRNDAEPSILVAFSASATTALAALRLGRRVICIERDPTYAALSRDRIQAELSSSTLQAHRAGQLPLLR